MPALAALALPVLAAAQDGAAFAVRHPWEHRSGLHRSAEDVPTLVHGHTVHVPGAPSLRLFLEALDVPGGGWLDVRSPSDGEVHRLTAAEAAKWGNSSGYFNGDTLVLELWAAPGARASFAVSHLLVGTASSPPGLCGPDDRVPATDNRVMRFLDDSGMYLCTGWLAGPDDCAFTGGQCFTIPSSTAEVNVPPSVGGAIQHPPIEDQFPVEPLVWKNGGDGDNWGLGRVLPNNLGESPSAKWGHFELGFFDPLPWETIRVTGFGYDFSDDDNHTNQTSTGPFAAAVGSELLHQVDTRHGSAGSPLIHEPTGRVVGLERGGNCHLSANSGTSLQNTDLLSAWVEHCSQEPAGVPVASFSVSASEVVEGQPVAFRGTSTDSPTAWAWDLDGDGVVDSTEESPTRTYEEPGLYTVTLTVSNDLGTDTVTKPALVTVNPVSPVSIPYFEDFQSGLPEAGNWLFLSSNPFGAIEAGGRGNPSPGSGDPALTLASNQQQEYVQNDAFLFVDMTGAVAATLTYWLHVAGDEAHPADGLFLQDGTTEVKVLDHGTGTSGWYLISLDLIGAALDAGLERNEDFRIVWRQYDNATLGVDGHVIDDVRIEALTTISGSVPLLSATFGGVQVLDLDGGVGLAGAPYLVLGSITGTEPGVVFSDLPIPLNQDRYLVQTAFSPNAFPLSGAIGLLNANGKGECKFTLPAGASGFAGYMFHHAFVTGDPRTQTLDTVSNAAPLLIIP